MSDAPAKIGLIGIGLVGSALAENLLAAGYDVTGYDVDPRRRDALVRIGGAAAASAAEAAAGNEALLLSLPDSNTVRKVLAGSRGLLSCKAAPRYIIDTTTGSPDDADRMAALCERAGTEYLDAAISGSSRQIRLREAVFLVGATAPAFNACRGLLARLAGKVFHLGPPGAGVRTKLASNLILGLNRVALAEGLVLAERLGLDLASFLAVLKQTPAFSRVMDSKGEKMIRGDFAPEARLAQHAKDVRIILTAARRAGLSLPLSRAHLRVLRSAVAAGDGDLDNSAVIRQLRRGPSASPVTWPSGIADRPT